MVWQVSRVVTGHCHKGRSIGLSDGPALSIAEMASIPGLALTDLWEAVDSPAQNAGNEDTAARPVRLTSPPSGTIFRIVGFPSDTVWRDTADADAAFTSIGAAQAHDTDSCYPLRHPNNTIDYIAIRRDEIHALLDEDEVLLRAEDCLVQRGTMHSWSVKRRQPCSLAAILVDAKPAS